MSYSLAELDSLDRDAFVAAVGPLFERSPWIVEETFARRPFRTLEGLRRELFATLRTAPRERQLELIRAHPDLAGRMLRAAGLTAESQREQAGAGLDAMGPEEAAELQSMNGRYRERFGFPFVICARLNDRASILAALRERLEHGPEDEVETALAEIEKIADHRLRDLVRVALEAPVAPLAPLEE
jgi:2-oxo-4-hydroxy-4-carboxy-5-ureidoimidazoline decarboxylase